MVIFGLEQLTKANEGRGDEVMGEATGGSYELSLEGMPSQHSLKGQADMWRLRSETRNGVTMRTGKWDQCHPRGERLRR